MIKRFFFVLMLMTLGITGAWADEVTEKQALVTAQNFLKEHLTPSNRKGQVRTPELIPLKETVSGLYVFNVEKNGGFIIVSNDDTTTPILGYGDSGNIDLDNMPENMRAWLQGYADEIAWWQQQDDLW